MGESVRRDTTRAVGEDTRAAASSGALEGPAVDALRESEARYERALEAAQDGHWEWNIATGELFVSARMMEMLGFGRDEKFADGKEFFTRRPIHPDDRTHVNAVWERALAGVLPHYEIEYRVVPRPGEIRWMRSRAKVFRDADGHAGRITGSLSDITDARLANDALRASEERYSLAMEASGQAFWDWDIVKDHYYVSPRMHEVLGLPQPMTYLSRTDFLAQIPFHPDDYARWQGAVDAQFAGRTSRLDLELRLLVQGQTRWIQVRGLLSRDPSGNPVRWMGSAADITERKAAEEALRGSEQRYALAMQAAAEGHVDWIVATDELYASPRVLEMCGLPADSHFGGRADFLARFPFHPEDRDGVLKEIGAFIAGRRTRLEIETRVLRQDETRWMHVTFLCLRDGSGAAQRVSAVTTDVTDSILAAAALRKSEERFALAVAGANEGIFDWDLATDLLFMSPRAQQLLALAPGKPLRRRREWLTLVRYHPDDVDRIRAALKAHVSGETTSYEIEFRILTRGRFRWFRQRGAALRDATGKAYRMAGSIEDVTDRKDAEGELRLRKEELQRLMDSISDCLWSAEVRTDGSFAYRYHSPVVERITGRRPEYFAAGLGRWLSAVHAPDRAALSDAFRRLIAGETDVEEMEYRIVRPDGAVRWVRDSMRATRVDDGRVLIDGIASDMTERRLAGDALRESEARFRSLLELLSDWYWRQDENLRFDYLSNQAKDLTGHSGESSYGKLRWELVDHRPLSGSWDEHKAVLAARQPFRDLECARIGADGVVRYLSMSGAPIFDADGRFKGYHGIGRNITERKRADEALREREARFRGLTELSSDWYWRQDEHLRFTYVSPGADDTAGYPSEASLGKARWELPDLTPISCSWVQHRATLESRQPFRDFEYSRIDVDGATRYISVSGAPIFDGQGRFAGYEGVARNITDRKRIEQELRARQEMLDLAQKAARAVAFEWKLGTGEGRDVSSPDLEAMYGVAPGTYDGSYDSWMKLVHPDDRPAVKDVVDRATPSGDVAAEYRIVHPDASVHWLQAKGRVFLDAQGTPERVVGFMLDVTDRRVAEEELRRMERALRQAQRLEAMGTLAGGIAHDFNNLLGAILGYGEMALRDAPGGSRLRRDIESMMIAGERGRALVDRVLAFSRSGIGEHVSVHVQKVVRETLALVAARLPANVTLERRLHAGRAAVLGDPTQIHQVLMNLATNAAHAMPDGGRLRVTLECIVSQAPRSATIGALAAKPYVVLRVSDTGAGIAPDVVERIFDPFFTTKEVGVGTGLGLSLVHGIVTGLGGAVDVETTVGAGSTFSVYLPQSGEAELRSARPERAPAPVEPGRREHILVVDDEEALVTLTLERLRDLGYVATGFTSGTAALEAFRSSGPIPFDALVTDESMPGMTGSELIRALRAEGATIPVLLVSGYLTPAVAQRARDAGADAVVRKPLPARELATSLARLLATRRGNRRRSGPPKETPARPRRRASPRS